MKKIKNTLLSINGEVLEVNGVDWVFIENDIAGTNMMDIVRGRLGRRKIQRGLELDESTQRFVEIDTPGWIYSNYLFDINSEGMAIEERYPYINVNLFAAAFTAMLNHHIEDLGDVYINPILSAHSIWEEVGSFKALHRAEFNLRLPNFNHKPEFSRILEEMKVMRAKRTTRVYENNQGLNTQAEFFKAGVEMSASAYGEFRLDGVKDNGQGLVVKSSDKARKSILGPIEDNPAKFLADFYRFLKEGEDERR